MERAEPAPFPSLWEGFCVPNFREWTAGEIVVQMPQARNLLAKHFGPEGITTGSGFRLKDLAKRKGVDLDPIVGDLNAMAKGTGMFV
jgi:iron-sulfur cluster repair protein YtfE (RIC family)